MAVGGEPDIRYYHSYWELGGGEKPLLLRAVIPECRLWNFQLNNFWMESLDYRHAKVHVNSSDAVVFDGPRGKEVSVVVADMEKAQSTRKSLSDRKVNWLDTCGYELGTMCWRWVHPVGSVPVSIHCEAVSLEELAIKCQDPTLLL
mmetsp:Transcript_27517/g.69128  ORF Transcript_27517/g.69128 Transcript_27517/m.69128 type:complete len:146 (+) Transcript_27517:116-553(+)